MSGTGRIILSVGEYRKLFLIATGCRLSSHSIAAFFCLSSFDAAILDIISIEGSLNTTSEREDQRSTSTGTNLECNSFLYSNSSLRSANIGSPGALSGISLYDTGGIT